MENPLPSHDNYESLANHSAHCFISKIDKIHENFIGIPALVPEVMDTPTLKKFAPLTPSQVTKLIANMQTKSSELDPIPIHVFKTNVSSPHLYNNSYHQHFTQQCLILQRVEDLNGKTHS